MGYLHEIQPRDKHDKIMNSINDEMNIYNLQKYHTPLERVIKYLIA